MKKLTPAVVIGSLLGLAAIVLGHSAAFAGTLVRAGVNAEQNNTLLIVGGGVIVLGAAALIILNIRRRNAAKKTDND